MNVLVVDIGGTHVKVLATGETEHREFPSGPTMTPKRLVAGVKKLTADWEYDVVAMGYPGPVLRSRPVADPPNLGAGWLGFGFAKAFGRPVKIINDAALQALGSYKIGGFRLWAEQRAEPPAGDRTFPREDRSRKEHNDDRTRSNGYSNSGCRRADET